MARSGLGTAPVPRFRWHRTRLGLVGLQLAVGVVGVLAWWLAASLELLPPEILPTPLGVLLAAVQLAVLPAFWLAVAQTVSNALLALGIAIVIGVPVGLLLGLAPPIERATRFLIDLGRSFPVIALLPVMILLFGATGQMEILVVVLAVIWPILLQTIYGSRRIDPVVRDTVRMYRIKLLPRFTKVLLPAAAPFTATGIRVAAAVSLLVAIAVELLGRTPGIGVNLGNAQVDARPDIALAYVLYAGLIGLGLNAVLQWAEDRALVWNARADVGAAGGAQ